MTIAEITEITPTVPLSGDEEFLCSKLVRQATQSGKDLVIHTGGQVRMNLCIVHQPQKTVCILHRCITIQLNTCIEMFHTMYIYMHLNVDPHISSHSGSSSTIY